MVSPFPVPKEFKCPYCGKDSFLGEFDAKTGVAQYHCKTEEKKQVGKHHTGVLTTWHKFQTRWDSRWVVMDEVDGHRAEEQFTLDHDGWVGYNDVGESV